MEQKVLADFVYKRFSLMGISSPYFCHGCDLTDFWTSTFLSFPLWKSCFLSDLEGS